jgi:hypothetical protein
MAGSNSFVYFKAFSYKIDAASLNFSSVCRLTTAGLVPKPDFEVFLPLSL